jgi:tripartite-type tricarboxylate transporter receptor subunit TctC
MTIVPHPLLAFAALRLGTWGSRGVVLLASVVLAGVAGHACGERFPAKPIKLVIPYPISGPTDIRGTSRLTKTYKLMAQHAPPPISDTLANMAVQAIGNGSPHAVVLERKPGGATTRGAYAVAHAVADGYTLLLASNATMVINPHYLYGVKYDPNRDFVLVAPLAMMPFVLLVNAGVPADSVKKLVEWAKVRPGEINYTSSGDGSTGHLAGELFRRVGGLDIVHVSYNGGLAALNGLATGQVSLMFAALPLALPYLGNEHLRALGVAGPERLELLPHLRTLAESGLAGFEIEAWFGIFVPTRTPPAARVWLTEQLAAYMTSESARARLLENGLTPAAATLGQFATRIHSEIEKWAPLLRASRTPFKGKEEG